MLIYNSLMAIKFYHGEDTASSYQALSHALELVNSSAVQLLKVDGAQISPALLQEQLNQDNFFIPGKIVKVVNVFARPKSKLREQLVAALIKTQWPLYWWEGKKITPTTLKPLVTAKAQINYFAQKDLIWSLLSAIKPHPSSQTLLPLYQQTFAQVKEKYKTGADIYILSMLIWQVQQLLEIKFAATTLSTFQSARLAPQAKLFSQKQLITLHQQLINLDYRAKSGQLKFSLQIELLLTLLEVS